MDEVIFDLYEYQDFIDYTDILINLNDEIIILQDLHVGLINNNIEILKIFVTLIAVIVGVFLGYIFFHLMFR